jgi:hypothetical protein
MNKLPENMESVPSPQELDTQSAVKIDRWIEVGSEEWREMDDTPDFTKKILRLGLHHPEPFLFTDMLGRIWGKGEGGKFYPFHFEYGKKLIGYRISALALN